MAADAITLTEVGVLGPQIGEGGQARVFRAPALVLPDAARELVLKAYRPGHQPPHGLRKLVAVRNGLLPADRDRLDGFAAWPLRVVEEGGQVLGVVLPLIHATFFVDRVLPGTGQRATTPREIQNLLIPPERALRIGMTVPDLAERFAVCRDFAAAVHFVHRQGLVLGDINACNALFRIGRRPTVMLVDCDSIRIRGNAAVVAQLNAPDWEPPERQLTQESDRFKFGLFVLRCLSTGDQMSTTRDPSRADAVLDQEGRALLRAALETAPGRRPTARDWGAYFHFHLTGQRIPPTATSTRPGPGGSPATSGGAGVPPRQSGGVATRGWVRDPATGQWTQP
ncbi:hypothetical protein [Asanoa siamensis]|uniref:Protein kinase domain-containing protein n=1 Tax=Asanoa siamensis TaxID=926357 RepID=A0ABQ4CRM7_9ACTN|nr:hypothetical protein [Asanoa siamensis]GIF73920.1 hypothetical protein Asi02nite_34380 [Asanoa siamensis]